MVLDRFNLVHRAAVPCAAVPNGALFCEERYFDDGWVRLSVHPVAGRAGCCRVERANLTYPPASASSLYCATDATVSLACAKPDRAPEGWQIGGQAVQREAVE